MAPAAHDPESRFEEFRRSGDPRALGDVYDLLAPELLRIALHTARDAATAEDVLQATFVAAIQQAQRYDPERRLLPWLVGILANEAARSRSQASREIDPERLAVRAQESPEDAAQRVELLARLEDAFERIPAAYRPVLQLRLRHGLTLPEIAAALERPPGTVRSQLARGSELLRRMLPASLAGALLSLVVPTRGLAAIRSELLAHALPAKAGAGFLSIALGFVAMKKFVIAGVALTALLLWWSADVRTQPEAPTRAETPPTRALDGEVASVPTTEALPAQDARRAESTTASAAVAAPAATGGNTRLTVHARWSDGTPAADEVVIVTTARMRLDEALTATTDSTGAAVLDDLAAGGAHVQLLRGQEGNLLLREGREHELTLEIPAGIDLDGRVRDARGEPVVDAAIWLSLRYRNDLGHVIAKSDAHGEFHVRSIPTEHHVGALARGFAPSSLRPVRGVTGDRAHVELTLERTATPVTIDVVDGQGAPIAAARVLFGAEKPASLRQEDGTFAPAAPPQRATTGADGCVTLECAPHGSSELQARAAGFAPARIEVNVEPGARNHFRIALAPEAKLVGSVVDSEGSPVSLAWVLVGEDHPFSSAETHTANDGSFEIGGLPSGRLSASIVHWTRGSAEREVELFAGGTTEWRATLNQEPRIEGEVRGQDGTPREGALLIANATDGAAPSTRSAKSDANGRFVIQGLEARSYTVSVQENDWRGFPLLEVADVWPDRAPLVLKLDGARAFGRIVLKAEGPAGTVVGGVELIVSHVDRQQWRTFTSNDAGELALENVLPGKVELEIRHAAYPWKRLGQHVVAPGATLDLGTVVFEAPGSLGVALRGPTAEECAKLQAMLADAANHESGVTRIADGRLTATALAPGKHTLLLGGEGWLQVRREFEITAGERTEFTLDLVAAGVRELQFHWPASSVVPGWIAFSLLDEHGVPVFTGNASCVADPPSARVSARPGTYQLWARAGGNGGELTGRAEIAMPAQGEIPPPAVIELVPKS